MDHIPLPKDPCPAPGRVPYVCDPQRPYDEGDFATYPARAQWPELMLVGQASALWIRHKDDVIDQERMRKQEIVLQSWLFFGNLHALLSPFNLYNPHDYIDSNDGELWLHTRNLDSRLVQFHDSLQSLDGDARDSFINNARHNYSISAEPAMMLNNDNYANFNRMIKTSVIIMCGTIEGAILKAINGNVHTLQPSLSQSLDKIAQSDMLRNGWCPSEIDMVKHFAVSQPSFRWYLSHMVKPGRPGTHELCSKQICRHDQIDLANYKTQHVDNQCECPALGPSMDDILTCLQEGEIPVLEVLGESIDSTAIKVHSAQYLPEDTAYIALSHVWADGLGNPFDNTLPTCQLQRLRMLLRGIESWRDTFEYGPASTRFLSKRRFFLWCDTLCCPVDPVAKQLALAQMRNVYLEAAFVLVLDSQLSAYNYDDISTLEAGWRLLMSRYMRRLWTFQEAGLAVKLLLQFQDHAADLLQIIKSTMNLYSTGTHRQRLYARVAATTGALRRWKRSDAAFMDLREATSEIAHRKVSVGTDEPLCLATVLGCPLEPLTEVKPVDRMQLLWQTIARSERGLRMTVIFNTLPRIAVDGFRWAPSSVLQHVERQLDTVELDGESNHGVLLSSGMRVRCPGWRIHLAGLPGYLPDSFWPESEERVPLMIHARHLDRTSYNLMALPDQGLVSQKVDLVRILRDRSKEWYVIIHRNQTDWQWAQWTSQRKALLVTKETNVKGLTYYKSHAVMTVDRAHASFDVSRQVDYIWGDSIRASWTLRAFNAISAYEKILDFIGSWLPRRLTTFLTGLLAPAFKWSGRTIGMRLRKMMQDTKSKAPRLAAAAALLQCNGNAAAADKVGSTIIAAVMGRYVRVEEIYDETTEWVVD